MLHVGGRRLPIVGRARLYVCGITPYDTTHLGHAATFVWADVASRVLRRTGVELVTCRNVTDVDDVLDAAAERAGARFDSFAAVGQFRFDRDMAALGVRPPTHEPRAHNHVDGVVALAAALLERGAAYERDGAVLFRAGQVPAPEIPPTPTRRRARRPGRVPTTPPTRWSGGRRRRVRRPGPAPGATGDRAGTRSARRWP